MRRAALATARGRPSEAAGEAARPGDARAAASTSETGCASTESPRRRARAVAPAPPAHRGLSTRRTRSSGKPRWLAELIEHRRAAVGQREEGKLLLARFGEVESPWRASPGRVAMSAITGGLSARPLAATPYPLALHPGARPHRPSLVHRVARARRLRQIRSRGPRESGRCARRNATRAGRLAFEQRERWVRGLLQRLLASPEGSGVEPRRRPRPAPLRP
jgi:hypothetical protein